MIGRPYHFIFWGGCSAMRLRKQSLSFPVFSVMEKGVANQELKAEIEFYRDVLQKLNHSGIPYMVGGAFAFYHYTGIFRFTKDLDIFCKSGAYRQILRLAAVNYRYEVTNARWLAKIFKGEAFIDIIFNSANSLCPVDESWFEHAVAGDLFDIPVRFLAPEEMIWSKIFVQDRERYDGSDINHLILRQGQTLNWSRLYQRLTPHWQLLLGQALNFQYVYPSERDLIPRWLMDELLQKASAQYEVPPTADKVCRGPYVDHKQYEIDVTQWGYKAIACKII